VLEEVEEAEGDEVEVEDRTEKRREGIQLVIDLESWKDSRMNQCLV